MKISIQAVAVPEKGTVVITLNQATTLGEQATALDVASGGALTRAIKAAEFKAEAGRMLSIIAPHGTGLDRVILFGIGEEKDLNPYEAAVLGGKIVAGMCHAKAKEATIIIEGIARTTLAADIAYGALLRGYHFADFKTKTKKEKHRLEKLEVQVKDHKEAAARLKVLEAVAEGVFLARDVVTLPPNLLYPDSYAKHIQKAFSGTKVKVKVLGAKEMKKLGMGALLGVGQGSTRESKLVVMEYKGGSKDKPIALVGKGVTFDTGGISIKPSAGMEDMKYDMGGSAAVVGAIKALSLRKAKANVIGVVGLVENMPDGNAQRPSDVVTSMSGQTIEVLNTDAEGRLVLADALWYAQAHYKPKWVIDLATLTGAITIALGDQYAGLFSNDDTLSSRITEAGQATGERVWRFPLGKEYDKMIDSPIADMQNISSGRGAGSITAAQFLQRFIQDGVAWAHLDIAGVAWVKENRPVCPKGAVGFGVQLLNALVGE